MLAESQTPWRVLAIDDEPAVRHLYQDMLSVSPSAVMRELDRIDFIAPQKIEECDEIASHFMPDVVQSGEEGVRCVAAALESRQPYAVICIDMHMPGGWDGLETAARIRALDAEVKLVFVTAYSSHSLSDIRKRIGNFFDFVSKPIEHDGFMQLMLSLAESWSQFRELRQAKQRLEQMHDQLTASLALEKEHTELIIESMREGVIVVDQLGNIEEVNPKVEQMIGKVEHQVAGLPISVLFEQQGETLDLIDNLVLGVQRLQQTINQDRSVLERRIDGSMLALLLVGEQGEILQSNSAMEELSGWRTDQLVASGISRLISPEMRMNHIEMMARFFAEDRPRKMGAGRLLPMQRADGSVVEVEIALLPILSEGERRVIVLMHDPAQRKKLEIFKYTSLGCLFTGGEQGEVPLNSWRLKSEEGESIPVEMSGSPIFREEGGRRRFGGVVLIARDLRGKLQAERAVRENRTKDEFLASVSHELRTPLTTIIGNSEILIEGAWESLSSEQQELLQSIEVSGRTQLALVNDILDLSKIGAGKFEIDESDFDLGTLLRDIEGIFSYRAKAAGLEFEVIHPRALRHQLIGDGKRIGQILINLLSNAVKFTRRGKVMLAVGIERHRICFEVKDQGIGMSPKAQARLFQPYEQADRSISSRFGGTGLGLNISWKLSQLMGGTIEVKSKEGLGSTFTLMLPFRISKQLAMSGEKVEQQSKAQRFQGEVLVVEDTPELQLLERRMLEAMGLSVTVAGNGQEGLQRALQHRYDLILMDMMMPVMDGVTATRSLRELAYRGPIVALSANAMQHHRQQFEEAGCNAILSKPIIRHELEQVLARYLGNAREAAPGRQVTPVGDPDLVELFQLRMVELRNQLEVAVVSADWEQIRQTSHMLKGAGSSFGFPRITELSEAVGDALEAEKIAMATEQVEVLLEELAKAAPQ